MSSSKRENIGLSLLSVGGGVVVAAELQVQAGKAAGGGIIGGGMLGRGLGGGVRGAADDRLNVLGNFVGHIVAAGLGSGSRRSGGRCGSHAGGGVGAAGVTGALAVLIRSRAWMQERI